MCEKSLCSDATLSNVYKKQARNLVKPDEAKNRLCEKERISCKSCAAARFLWYGKLTEKRSNLRTGCPSDEGGEHMFEITRLTVEHLAAGCVTDCSTPRIGFSLSSDRRGAQLADAELTVGDWSAHVTSGQSAAYVGPALLPFTTYSVRLNATDDAGETATATTTYEAGRMETPWKGRWISDPSYHFTEAKVSPVPMVFRKEITTNKPIARARLYATAMGIYEAELNGQKLGEQYFAPGFTSYKSYLQYQTYDITALLTGVDTLIFTVAGGWAVGSFVFTRKNRVTADRQALLAELRIEYTDGTTETIGTDATWQVSESGPVRMADLYDGEAYDATQEISDWHNAAPRR